MDWDLQIRELTLTAVIIRAALAIVLGGVVGMEREMKNRAAGFRTYMLVSLGSAVVMITNQYVYQLFQIGDPVRMGAQVVSGIGFLGAGTIIVTGKKQVKGLTTAAGLWAAACVGLAVGIGFYEIAIVGGICILLVMTLFHSWENFLRRKNKVLLVYIELEPQRRLREFLNGAREQGISFSNIQLEETTEVHDTGLCFVATAKNKSKEKKEILLKRLEEIPTIQYIEEL